MSFQFKLPYLEYVSMVGKAFNFHMAHEFRDHEEFLEFTGLEGLNPDKERRLECVELWLDSIANRYYKEDCDDILDKLPSGVRKCLPEVSHIVKDGDKLYMYGNHNRFLDPSIAIRPSDVELYRVREVTIECLFDNLEELKDKLQSIGKLNISESYLNKFTNLLTLIRRKGTKLAKQEAIMNFCIDKCLIVKLKHSISMYLSDNAIEAFGLKYIPERKDIELGELNIFDNVKKNINTRKHRFFNFVEDKPLNVGPCLMIGDTELEIHSRVIPINNYLFCDFLKNTYFNRQE